MKIQYVCLTLSLALVSVAQAGGVLQQAGEQALKNAATSALPQGSVEKVQAAKALLDKAKTAKTVWDNSPDFMKEQMKKQAVETAKDKLKQAAPDKLKQGLQAAEQLKGQVGNLPKSTGEASTLVKDKLKQEAVKRILQ